MNANLLQVRRFKLSLAHVAFLLALPLSALGLLAWMPAQDRPLADTQTDLAPLDREYLPQGQAISPTQSLPEILAHADLIPTHHHPLLNEQAPDFELADSEGKILRLRDLQAGSPVVLIFYYGFHCVHCVRQLFDVNRDLSSFAEAGARVVAISPDPPELTRPRLQRYGRFGFPVLSDPGNKVAQAYQVFRADSLRHATFIIDQTGTVRWVNVGDMPFRRNSALLFHLARLELCLPSTQPED